jgi:O-methyltransferase
MSNNTSPPNANSHISFRDSLSTSEDNRLFDVAIEVLQQLFPQHFFGDKMFVADRAVGFLRDAKFLEVLDEVARADIYRGMAWRCHTLCWAGRAALNLEGDFVECGVFRGFKSFFLLRYLADNWEQKRFWLYDTYEGLADSYSEGSPVSKEDHNKPELFEFVKDRFSVFPQATVIQGTVPDVLHDKCPEKVAFLHLDMNSFQAEIGALEVFFDRLTPGATIILDDYGFSAFDRQKVEEDLWFGERGYSVLELPTGQGLVIKR